MGVKKEEIYKEVSIDNFRDLNRVLKNTFSALKKDLEETRNNLLFTVNTIKAINKELEDSKKDYVSIDKLNSLKIRVGDMNEEMKRVDRIEKALNEATARMDEQISLLGKKAADNDKIKENIRELQNTLSVVEKISKGAVAEASLRKLAKEVSEEVNEMLRKMQAYEEEGGNITKAAIDRMQQDLTKELSEVDKKIDSGHQEFSAQIDGKETAFREKVRSAFKKFRDTTASRMAALDERISKANKESEGLVNRQQVQEALRDINREFDAVRDEIEEAKGLKQEMKLLSKEKVGRSTFNKGIEELHAGIEEVKGGIEDLKELEGDVNELSKQKVSREDHEKSILDLNNRIEKLRDEVTALNAIKKEVKTEKGRDRVRNAKKRVTMYNIASFFLFFSFALLGASFVSWFIDKAELMNYFVYSAVAVFVAGLVLRIAAVVRE